MSRLTILRPCSLAFAMALALMCSREAFADPLTFVSYPVGTFNHAFGVAIDDVNLDGNPDLIVSNLWGTTGVSVLLGNGNGTFQPQTDFPAGFPNPWGAVLTGDLNGDTLPDLVVSGSGYGTVSVLLGVGQGAFGAPSTVSTGSSLQFTAPKTLGDVNGDGRTDLVTANDVAALVMFGNGDGTFGAPASYPLPAQASSVALGDVNGDGRVDMIAGSLEPSSCGLAPCYISRFSLFVGNGDGTFGPSRLDTRGASTDLTLVDLNGDGRLDLVASWKVRLGNGDGTFGQEMDFMTYGGNEGSWGYHVPLGDLDGDGRLDMAETTYNMPNIAYRFGNGNGTFGTRYLAPAGTRPDWVAMGDLNRDGRLDLVVTNELDPLALVLIQRVFPTATALTLFDASWSDRGVEVRWRLEPSAYQNVWLERRGPSDVWQIVEGDRREEQAISILLDREVANGQSYTYRLMAQRTEGGAVELGSLDVTVGGGVLDLHAMPNPSQGEAAIVFTIPQEEHIRLGIVDVEGRLVCRLADDVRRAGTHRIVWTGGRGEGSMAPGLYFVVLESPRERLLERLVLVR